MPWDPLPVASTWPELRQQLFEVSESDKHAFRGQSRDFGEGRLLSSIDRALVSVGVDGESGRVIERIAIQRFLQHAPNWLPAAEMAHLQDGPAILMLMRHYLGPTRLLDWTESVWMAAFHAVNGEWKDDGRIWMFDRHQFDIHVHNKYHHETQIVPHTVLVPPFGPLPVIVAADLEEWVCRLMGTGHRIPRVIAQQGMFTVGSRLGIDHAAFIDDVLPNGRAELKHIIEIKAALKPTVLKEIAKMGITAGSLFPGIDGVGRAIDGFVHYGHLDANIQEMARGESGRPDLVPIEAVSEDASAAAPPDPGATQSSAEP